MSDQVRDQLVSELITAVERLAAVVPQLAPRGQILEAIRQATPGVSAILGEDSNSVDRAEMVSSLMTAIWGQGDPDLDWWTTPLAAAVAPSLGPDQARSWTYAVAAAYLGVVRGTVSQLVQRGKIRRHPDAGLVIADVIGYGLERGSGRRVAD